MEVVLVVKRAPFAALSKHGLGFSFVLRPSRSRLIADFASQVQDDMLIDRQDLGYVERGNYEERAILSRGIASFFLLPNYPA